MKKITIFTDGGSRGNPGPAAIGVQITDARGTVVREVFETIGNATNTFAAYYAVMRGLQVAQDVFGKSTRTMQVELKLDNDFVKKQLSGEVQIKEPGLVPYFIEIHNMKVASFPKLTYTHIGREFNKEADRLVNKALDTKQ
jgi:ribonuclease HI